MNEAHILWYAFYVVLIKTRYDSFAQHVFNFKENLNNIFCHKKWNFKVEMWENLNVCNQVKTWHFYNGYKFITINIISIISNIWEHRE